MYTILGLLALITVVFLVYVYLLIRLIKFMTQEIQATNDQSDRVITLIRERIEEQRREMGLDGFSIPDTQIVTHTSMGPKMRRRRRYRSAAPNRNIDDSLNPLSPLNPLNSLNPVNMEEQHRRSSYDDSFHTGGSFGGDSFSSSSTYDSGGSYSGSSYDSSSSYDSGSSGGSSSFD